MTTVEIQHALTRMERDEQMGLPLPEATYTLLRNEMLERIKPWPMRQPLRPKVYQRNSVYARRYAEKLAREGIDPTL